MMSDYDVRCANIGPTTASDAQGKAVCSGTFGWRANIPVIQVGE